ncbi:hypothetical protein ACFLZV_04165 [Candidatus Margulisiibacteriota bacterium]
MKNDNNNEKEIRKLALIINATRVISFLLFIITIYAFIKYSIIGGIMAGTISFLFSTITEIVIARKYFSE